MSFSLNCHTVSDKLQIRCTCSVRIFQLDAILISLYPFPFLFPALTSIFTSFLPPSLSRPVGPSTRCSFMRRQTLAARPWRPQRTAPHFWKSSAGGRSTPVRSTMVGGFSTSTPTTVDVSTSWRRENTESLGIGVLPVLLSSLLGASLNNLNPIQKYQEDCLGIMS